MLAKSPLLMLVTIRSSACAATLEAWISSGSSVWVEANITCQYVLNCSDSIFSSAKFAISSGVLSTHKLGTSAPPAPSQTGGVALACCPRAIRLWQIRATAAVEGLVVLPQTRVHQSRKFSWIRTRVIGHINFIEQWAQKNVQCKGHGHYGSLQTRAQIDQ